MKRESMLLVIFLFTFFNLHTASAKVQFKDVPSTHDAYSEIQYLVNLGAIKGYETPQGTYYKPYNPVTRGQAAKMVVVSTGSTQLSVTRSSFSDVKAGTELSGYVERAVNLGYFSGVSQGKFAPHTNLTRQEMAKVLSLAFNLNADQYANLSVPFKDISKNHPYYKYIAAIYYNGITQGSPSGKERVYMPSSSVTRGQFASFIARAKENRYRLPLPIQGVHTPKEEDAIGTVVSTTNNLNVRTSPSTANNSNRIGQIHKGDKLPLFEIQSGWMKVLYKGQYAYISAQYAEVVNESSNNLDKVEKEVITRFKVNVFESNDIGSKLIGNIHKGERVPVYKTVGNWYLTSINGLTGYILISQTKDVEDSVKPPVTEPVEPPVQSPKPPVETPIYTTNTVGKVTVSSLNIRSQASDTSNVVGKLTLHDVVAVHSISGNWANITTSDGTEGYVHKSYVKLINQSGSPIKDRIIVIDAGHGGKDPGATSNGALEKDIVLKVATSVKNKLEADGAKVVLTRSNDTYYSLDERVDIAQKHYADVFVSLHVNAASNTSAQGTETYYSVQGNGSLLEKDALAAAINRQIVKNANMRDRGVKTANFVVIKNTAYPAVLVELGFITNSQDRAKLTDNGYIEIFADSIYKGIVEYYQK